MVTRLVLTAGLAAVLISASASSSPSQFSPVQPPPVGAPAVAPPAVPGPGGAGPNAGYPDPNAFFRAYGEDGKLDRETRRALQEWSEAKDESARLAAREKLMKLLSDQFDERQKRREKEIAEIEARVQKLRDTLRKRTEAKQSIVISRLDQLLRDAQGLGWGDEEIRSYRPGATPTFVVPAAK